MKTSNGLRRASARKTGLVFPICATVLACILTLCWFCWHRPEARYKGKTARQWFRQYDSAYARALSMAGWGGGGGFRGPIVVYDAESAEAFQHLGTNAAVYIGQVLLHQERVFNRSYRQAYIRMPAPIQQLLPHPLSAPPLLTMEMEVALRAIGRDAQAAIPWLGECLRHADPRTARMIIHVLKQIQCDPPHMDPLLREWSASGQITNIVDLLEESPARSRFAAECLGRILAGDSVELRHRAVNILRNYRSEGASAVPHLAAALHDPDVEVRYGAASALEAIGSPALAAIPALQRATNDSVIMVQRASARALRVIQTGAMDLPP